MCLLLDMAHDEKWWMGSFNYKEPQGLSWRVDKIYDTLMVDYPLTGSFALELRV